MHRAKSLAQWKSHLQANWGQIKLARVDQQGNGTVDCGAFRDSA